MTAPGMRRLRRSAAALVVLLAVGVSVATATRAWAASPPGAAAAPPPAASTGEIQAAFGAQSKVPVEFVFLVDLSGSMGSGGIYSTVVSDLSTYLGYLAAHESQDHVDVITFWRKGTANVLYDGPPQADVGLPTTPENGSTDFGPAFDLALTSLGRAPSGTKFGVVMLLSDGVLHAVGDPQYATYQSAGWANLARRATVLPYPVHGYAVPLSGGNDVVTNQDRAFEAVFTNQQPKTFPANAANLGQQLRAIDADVLNNQVVNAANQESGKGVQVKWSSLSPAGKQLDFTKSGQLDVLVTLTAKTRHIPLYVTGLSLAAPGLPITVSGSLPPVVQLEPGVPFPLHVRLTWQRQAGSVSVTGSTGSDSGRLVLTGKVNSTFTPELVTAFDDTKFLPGTLQGATSPLLKATTAAMDLFMYVLVIILVLAALALLLVLREFSRAMLRGSLRLTSVDQLTGEYPLPRKLSASVQTNSLIGIPGQLTVHGRLFRRDRAMRVTLELANRPVGYLDLKPGGNGMAAGVDIAHSGRQ
jgi:hypothetical protein